MPGTSPRAACHVAVTDAAGQPWTHVLSVDVRVPWPAKKRIARTDSDRADDLYFSTDQKVGGSSPSERAQLTGVARPATGFLVALGATLGATGTRQPPNRARLIDSAAARLSSSSRCPYTSLVTAMLACPSTSEPTCSGVPWASISEAPEWRSSCGCQ